MRVNCDACFTLFYFVYILNFLVEIPFRFFAILIDKRIEEKGIFVVSIGNNIKFFLLRVE